MIAVTHPGRIGDALYALPTIRWLCQKHGCQADFYTSEVCRPMLRLMRRQSCIHDARIVDGYVIAGNGPGIQPWYMSVPDQYAATYHLGLKTNPGCFISNHVAREVGAPDGLPIAYEFDDRREFDGDYVVMAPRGHTTFRATFEDVINRSPFPVVQIGATGEAIAGGIDRTGLDMVDTLPLLAHCRAFVGLMSSQLVLANAFPCIKIAPHDGKSWDMRHPLYGYRNHYPVTTSAIDIVNRLKYLPSYSKTFAPDDYWCLTNDTPDVDDATTELTGLYHPFHTHRRWEYGVALQAIRRHGGKRVLDIGGGGSLFAGILAKQRIDVDVNDPVNYTGWIVAQREKIGHHIGFACCPMEDLTETYPIVTCISTLEHIPDHEWAWRRLLALVQPGGLLFVTVDYHESGSQLHPGHLRTYNRGMLLKLIDRADDFEPFLGEPEYCDGGSEVHGYNFASICLRRKS